MILFQWQRIVCKQGASQKLARSVFVKKVVKVNKRNNLHLPSCCPILATDTYCIGNKSSARELLMKRKVQYG